MYSSLSSPSADRSNDKDFLKVTVGEVPAVTYRMHTMIGAANLSRVSRTINNHLDASLVRSLGGASCCQNCFVVGDLCCCWGGRLSQAAGLLVLLHIDRCSNPHEISHVDLHLVSSQVACSLYWRSLRCS